MVLELSAIARERVVLATVADVLVAAAAGRGLRVAVVCPDSQVTFVGHLTRALHARGRAGRCVASTPTPAGVDRRQSADPAPGHSTVMVITCGACAPGPDEVCRVTIRVTTDAPTASATDDSHRQPSDPHPDADPDPDIVLDYHDPSGPTIRQIVPRLSPPPAPR
ncbi:hypothetical protein U2F26_02890 [Micromonospora sp. 4G57]|uniref:Uncharacterized protein n=1 Tax=Micromonospora sicca TaxID=2202420 RepID=A0ABU5JCG6_9ACTN|nr:MULTISPECIES: hypothetical protein [unclassified Micromonospora]MDZ5441677.1 hypothetical protein [Micromonospora sp. 4G57]MDZ5490238.1 hypothetical protein [Micromonospora sp. 4G53]